MYVLRAAVAVLFLSMFFTVPGVRAEEAASMAALPPEWREEEQQATIFAQDWIADLDAENFAAAAKRVLSLGKEPDPSSPKTLRALRAEMGEYSERVLMEKVVYAAATDNSECKARVSYSTKAAKKNVVEVVEVLLVKGQKPAVLDYRLEPYQKADIGIEIN